MNRTVLIALPFALVVGALAASPADAGGGFSIFGGFRVGGIHFDVGLHHAGHRYGPAPYYRVGGPLRYSGYRCGDLCYRHGGFGFHHAGCPLVLRHFRAYRFVPPPFGWYGDGLRHPAPWGYRDHHGHRYPGWYGHRGRGYGWRGPAPHSWRDGRYGERYRYDSKRRGDRHWRDRFDSRHDRRWDDRRHDHRGGRGRRGRHD